MNVGHPTIATVASNPTRIIPPVWRYRLRAYTNHQPDIRACSHLISLCQVHVLPNRRPTWLAPKTKPAKRVARSAGFAICSPRGIGDPNEDASGINASEGFQYGPGTAARKILTPLVGGQGVEPGAREVGPRCLWILLQERVPRGTFSLNVRYHLDGRLDKNGAEVADSSRSDGEGELRARWEFERDLLHSPFLRNDEA